MSRRAVDGGVACPVCAGQELRHRADVARRYPLVTCVGCGHTFVRPDRLPARHVDEHYAEDYAGFRADPVFARVAREFATRTLPARVPPPARVLDVGCGNGEFLAAARDAGYQVQGFDVSEAAVRFCRSRGIDAVGTDFATAPLAPGSFDVVTMWDVIEHVPDPLALVSRARELLRPNGVLFVKTPDIRALSVAVVGVLPRIGGALLAVPSHIQFFDRAGLGRVLERSGFGATQWLDSMGTRSPGEGGGLRRRAVRRIVSAIHQLSGDSNAMVFATRS